jgi:hypothetical protein
MLKQTKRALSHMNKQASKYAVGASVAFMSLPTWAASALDATLLTGFETDVTDTAAEYKTFVIGIIFILALVGLAINMTKKATRKAGGGV